MSAELPSIFSTHNLHRRAMELLTPAARVQVASEPSRNAILSEGRFAEVIIVRAPLPPQLFEAADRLRAVIRHGAGLDMIPVEEATRAGVLVANVPAVNASSVAEYVIFAAIALLRRFRLVDRDLRTGGWNAGRAHADFGIELTGRRLGIVGMG
ncbi:MAG TPA: dehydrogenase, partial [Rhizobiaceae bacterium]|nr:dehydrogenase [Rhizobiaceae bacterium]